MRDAGTCVALPFAGATPVLAIRCARRVWHIFVGRQSPPEFKPKLEWSVVDEYSRER
jgi:hypothetical protein